jgi:hypothetical protein
MMTCIKHFFAKDQNSKAEKSDFSAFFHDASSAEKMRVMKKVIRKANEDQRKVIEKYEKMTKVA